MAEEAFANLGLNEIRLEVFNHNQRAIAAYSKVGFEVSGEHVEWVPHRKTELRVIEMRFVGRLRFRAARTSDDGDSTDNTQGEAQASGTPTRRKERNASRTKRKAETGRPPERPEGVSDSPQTVPAAELTRTRLTGGTSPLTIGLAESPSREIPRTATWESRSDGAARGWDAIGGGVGTRDRERAARSGFATRIGSGSARGWSRRTDRGSARAAIGSVPNLVAINAASRVFRGEMTST